MVRNFTVANVDKMRGELKQQVEYLTSIRLFFRLQAKKLRPKPVFLFFYKTMTFWCWPLIFAAI